MTIPFAGLPVGVLLPKSWENGSLLVISFLLLLLGAEVFTNGVEWLGHRLGVSESATGSILAATGTALPETTIPIIAIIQGGHAAESVGVGAILGAPFMLATIALFLVGVSLYYFADRRTHGTELDFNETSTSRDVSFFLVGYLLAFVAALIASHVVRVAIAVSLVGLYLVYLYRSLKTGDLVETDDLDDLHVGLVLERVLGVFGREPEDHSGDPHFLLVALQTLVALSFIVGGARLFVTEVEWASLTVLGIPTAVVALLIAPVATELPETFNSVLWISRDKETLALGNITGAMAFQGTLPVAIGILFTPWDLSFTWGTSGFLNAFSVVLALVSGVILYSRVRRVGSSNMTSKPFLLGGLFYLAFIGLAIYYVLFVGVAGVN